VADVAGRIEIFAAGEDVKHTWTLSKMRMLLALRNPTFLFFSLVFPLGFLFLYAVVFAKSNPLAITYLMGPVLALTVMGSFWGLSLQLVTFRETGILRRFRLAPVGAASMLASSIISNYFLAFPTVVIEFLICRYFFHMTQMGNLLEVFLMVSIGSITFSSFGLIVASVTNTMQETQVINQIIWFAFLFFSGATLPLVILPDGIQRAALFLPATYLVAGLQGSMLQSATPADIAGDVFVLAVGLLVSFEISRRLFRWEPEEKVPARAKVWVVIALIPFFLLGVWENVAGNRLQQIHQNYQYIERATPPDMPH
jgi:ABC-2 type transport system permease protein